MIFVIYKKIVCIEQIKQTKALITNALHKTKQKQPRRMPGLFLF